MQKTTLAIDFGEQLCAYDLRLYCIYYIYSTLLCLFTTKLESVCLPEERTLTPLPEKQRQPSLEPVLPPITDKQTASGTI